MVSGNERWEILPRWERRDAGKVELEQLGTMGIWLATCASFAGALSSSLHYCACDPIDRLISNTISKGGRTAIGVCVLKI